MDVSTRRLRYFLAVADDLHFSRAAARLFVSQQVLSKQINELEHDLGVTLFDRSTRRVELTPAGLAFRPACRELLATLDQATASARAAGRAEQHTVAVGFFVLAALELTTPILTEFSRRYPAVRVVLQEYAYRDPSAGLADGDSDVAIVRLPIELPELQSTPLFTEPRVVAVAAGHRLAGRTHIGVQDLAGERLTSGINDDPQYRAFWGLSDYLSTATPPVETTSHTEELEVVATGQACSVTAACAARYAPHAQIRFIPIDDVPGVTTALAWRGSSPDALVERFVRVATEIRDRELDIVRAIEHPSL